MAFKLIDIENWERREFYEHFINEVVCTYSAVVNIDITNLKGQKLYPAMIWLLTKTVNDMPEFRTSLTKEGLGIYDDMHPMYTVFNKENKNFSGIWSYFSEDYAEFLKSYEADSEEYSKSTRYAPKDGNYTEYGKSSSKVYTYVREDEKQKILVVCSFSEKTVKFKAPVGFDTRTAELILTNYEANDGMALKPYETRVYLLNK